MDYRMRNYLCTNEWWFIYVFESQEQRGFVGTKVGTTQPRIREQGNPKNKETVREEGNKGNIGSVRNNDKGQREDGLCACLRIKQSLRLV